MNLLNHLARGERPSQGFPDLHGDVGIFDELALIACVIVVAVVVVAFYVAALRKSKEDK